MTVSAPCPYCGVGCRLQPRMAGNRVVGIEADATAAPNYGAMCQKGAYLADVYATRQGRAQYPLLRNRKDQPLRRVDWDEALDFVARRLMGLQQQHGRDAIAWYGSGQLDTEASYVFTKLFKGYLGTNNTDTNSRLCMSSAVAAYVKAFGADAPATCYDDIDAADVFLMVGANMASNHPVLFERIRRRRVQHSGVRIVCLDPRKTKTAELSDVHVPLVPGSDVAFLLLVARKLLCEAHVDRRFVRSRTDGFEAFCQEVMAADETALLQVCDVHPGRVQEVAELLAGSKQVLSFYCQGTNQATTGVDKNLALINLHLMLGAVARPGAGPFSLTGQPNAMGGREVGYLAHQLPGYRLVKNPKHRAQMETHWALAPGRIASNPGLAAVGMFDALAANQVHGIWISGTNPVVSMPDSGAVRRGLSNAALVVVQDCYHPTETSQYADVILPACQWGEKTGTMTNSERLVQRAQAFLTPPGEARPDWWITAAVARQMGFAGFEYADAEQIWSEYIQTTVGTECDQSGMQNDRLAEQALHWPCPSPTHPGTPRRYRKKFATANGRARFHPVAWCPPAEAVNPERPLVLTTGRVAAQWHTRTRTGKVAALNGQAAEPFAEMHPDDAHARGITDLARIVLTGVRGRAVLRVRVTRNIRPGTIFVPFHWGDLYHRDTNINNLTNPACDPVSGQPELKFTAVEVQVYVGYAAAPSAASVACLS